MANHSIVPVKLAVKAMRDNGYKNAAYAIAELIDNSIQAGAKSVELVCAEDEFQANQKVMKRITNIAILDNGKGMDADTLRMALQFGNGTNLTIDKQTGIGKFGMGLPSASISQAKKVEVWTWQSGVENAIYSYLDLEEIISGDLEDVPAPVAKEVPKKWLNASESVLSHGTLVVWSDLDKCIWKTASAVFKNSEFVIGRMYRYYIQKNEARIRMVSFMNNIRVINEDKEAKANDPLYLMSNTSCPAPYDIKPMFREFPDESCFILEYPVEYAGKTYMVKVKYSIAKEEARIDRNSGSLPHGKHAAKNVGVSLVRAGRELHLDDSLCLKYNPTERWWGVEVSFPPALDEIFGVTNNKQYANNFSELANYDIKEYADDEYGNGMTFQELKQTLEEDEDPKAKIINLVNTINGQIKSMRLILKQQGVNKGQGGRVRHRPDIQTAEEFATATTEKRKEELFIGTSDRQDSEMDSSSKIEAVREELEENSISEGDQEEILKTLFDEECGVKYQFIDGSFDGNAFFSVKPKGGKIIITLNMEHPAYANLIEILNDPCEDCSQEELQERLRSASDGLKLLLMAWARYEDEEPDGDRKRRVQSARQDWGKIAYDFLEKNK